MARENVMSTPIFDELLREMAQRAEPRAPTAPPPASPPAQENAGADAPRNGGSARRRHRAD